MTLSYKVTLALLILGIGSSSVQAAQMKSAFFNGSLNLALGVAETIPGINTVGAPLIQSGKYYVDQKHREPFSEIFSRNLRVVSTGIAAAHLFLVLKSSDYRNLSLGAHLVLGGCGILFGTAWMSNSEYGKQLEEKTRTENLEVIRANQEQQAVAIEGLQAVVIEMGRNTTERFDRLGQEVQGLKNELALFHQAFAQFKTGSEAAFLGINNKLTTQAQLISRVQSTLSVIQSTMDTNHAAIMRALQVMPQQNGNLNHNNIHNDDLD